MDAGHSPMVRIFKITAVSPFEYTDSKRIVSILEDICDIKLARKTTVLRISHLLSVHPYLMAGINAAEMQDHTSSLPISRNRKRADI